MITDVLLHFMLEAVGGCTANWVRCQCPTHRAVRYGVWVVFALFSSYVTVRLIG